MPAFNALSDEGITPVGPNGLTWAGQSDDPFFLDLRVFDLLYGGDFSEVGDDTLAGFNVNTMALQVPMDNVAKGGDASAHPIIGVWSTASRKSLRVQDPDGGLSSRGDFVQVSRLGSPLVNEVVIPYKDKDKFNASRPVGRRAVPALGQQARAAGPHRADLRDSGARLGRHDAGHPAR